MTLKYYAVRLLVAVKTQNKKRLAALAEVEQIEALQREMSLMRELHHENVVEWFHTIETTTGVYVVLEFCSNGTLFDVIKQQKGLSEAETKIVFVQILSALLYMHSKGKLT